jgi:acetylornithine deacetylase
VRDALERTVHERKDRLFEILCHLIRIPSENRPPSGAESSCQQWLANELLRCGLSPDLYELKDVSGLKEHPLFQAGRDYGNRPNLGARLPGQGGGRSLLLSGHIDTVPSGTQEWTRSPFGAETDGGRTYGRGSCDMKAGIATSLFVVECLSELKLRLAGDLMFETVVDEEFGGSNGTLAGRLRGYNADAAIITEPSNLRICPAQRGGRTVHLKLRCPDAGVLDTTTGFASGILDQLTYVLSQIPHFAAQRNTNCRRHELYATQPDPVPVSVLKVHTSPWGWNEPLTVPASAMIEIYWQLMPGETQADVDAEFRAWLQSIVNKRRELFSIAPEVSFPLRWLPGSAISTEEPLVEELARCAESLTGSKPVIAGIEGPCDMFILHNEFKIPTVLWGPSGGKIHSADEYVELDSVLTAAKVLLFFAVQWCGLANGGRSGAA